MKAFISWSGDKSKALARSFHDWLPMVVQSLEPWLSDRDISPGAYWGSALAKRLAESELGLVCVTRDNIESPWLLFESGALSRGSLVVPILFDIDPSDLKGPLTQFQSVRVDRGDLQKLLDSLLKTHSPKMSDSQRGTLFDVTWPLIDRKLVAIRQAFHTPLSGEQAIVRELLVGDTIEQGIRSAKDLMQTSAMQQYGGMEPGTPSDSPEQARAISLLIEHKKVLESELAFLQRQEEELNRQDAPFSLIDRAIRPKEAAIQRLESAIRALRPRPEPNIDVDDLL